jgi:excisionase family DNA binding protein
MSRTYQARRQEPEQLVLFPPTRYLTIEEVAALMSVPKSFIYRRTCRGHSDPIPSFRFGGHLRFRLDEIERWIATHRVEHEELPRVEVSVRRSAAAAKVTRRSSGRLQRQTSTVKSRSG